MAELLGCRNCGASWSAPNNPTPGLLKYMWCNDCGGQSFIPIGEVYGVTRPGIHMGTSAPGPTHRTPLLMLTDGTDQSPGGVQAPAQAPAPARRQVPEVNVLPSNSTPIVMGASEQMLKEEFLGHSEGDVLSFPPESLIKKYFPGTTDAFELKKGEMKSESKTYARLIAIYLLEKHGASLAIEITSPKGSTYNNVQKLKRDLGPTLLRIAKGEGIAKALNNAAYNNDGCQTSNKVKYDRYGKGYKGARPNSAELPAPSTSAKYWEYYVDRDNAKGSSALSIGAGKPGAERLFFGAPDYVYYTWNHYGSDVGFGPQRSALTESDIWAVFSISKKKWVTGLTR